MHPVLLKLGPIAIHAYGLMLAISFMIGIYWAMARAPKRGIEKNDILDLSIVVVICAILGSRLFYVITHLDEFAGRWTDTFNPLQSTGEVGISGLSMLGGVVLVLIALVIYSRIKKISIIRLCDTIAPTFALGIGLTRIGCFLNGCCFGKPGDYAWCMKFPLNSPAGSVLQNVHIHPTQLYSSLYGFLILLVIVLVDRKKRPDGLLLSIFFMLYGIGRFFIDFVRYYEASVQFHFIGWAFTFNQAISLVLFLIGLFFFIKLIVNKPAAK
jgi:phosphatidylglycerol:prolipoprotein diacylglycerol transferase